MANLQRTILVLLAAAGLVAAGLVAAGWRPAVPPPPAEAPVVVSQGPTVERLERLAQLVSMRVCVADVLTAEGEGHRGAWLVRGDGLIGVDLAQARIVEKDNQSCQATVLLPLPRVLLARVDHQRTKTWEVRRTTWVPWRGDQDALRDSVMLHAQRMVAEAAGSEEHLAQARLGAEAVIRAFYEEVGWRVRVVWDLGAETSGSEPPSPGQGDGGV
jgi:hypothetical protein